MLIIQGGSITHVCVSLVCFRALIVRQPINYNRVPRFLRGEDVFERLRGLRRGCSIYHATPDINPTAGSCLSFTIQFRERGRAGMRALTLFAYSPGDCIAIDKGVDHEDDLF